jgi:hypothetical protein
MELAALVTSFAVCTVSNWFTISICRVWYLIPVTLLCALTGGRMTSYDSHRKSYVLLAYSGDCGIHCSARGNTSSGDDSRSSFKGLRAARARKRSCENGLVLVICCASSRKCCCIGYLCNFTSRLPVPWPEECTTRQAP